jgi:hypothetical protein
MSGIEDIVATKHWLGCFGFGRVLLAQAAFWCSADETGPYYQFAKSELYLDGAVEIAAVQRGWPMANPARNSRACCAVGCCWTRRRGPPALLAHLLRRRADATRARDGRRRHRRLYRRHVPALADKGIYIASESSFHRVLRAHGQMHRRGGAKPPTNNAYRYPPWRGLVLGCDVPAGTGPGTSVLSVPDPRSLQPQDRRLRGARYRQCRARRALAKRAALAEGIHAKATRPVLHGDNGATLKATTVLAMLYWLGIKPSYSRSRG